jgi:hypothetical protein
VRRCHIGHHQGEGFELPMFAFSQAADNFFVGGIAGEVITTQSFHG